MKKIILTSICALSLYTSKAQVVIDPVSIGAGYANQKWYSLQNDEQGSAAKNNWDIAFDVSGYGTSIHINSIIGTLLWKSPSADTAGWSTVDTTGITTWTKLYNSDTTWAIGAFDKGIVVGDPYDLGWGVYSPITHIVTGDSLYIIKLSSGASLQNGILTKSTYTGKNFGYYSIQTNAALDREALSANWDLMFTQYTTFIPNAYTVSGILSNKGVTIAQANNIGNVNTYNNWSAHTFITPINEIGYDWKTFNGVGYDITDSLIYFVKTNAGDIWKVIPTGFGGSATGNYMFSKEELSSTGITDAMGNTKSVLSIYPNPSSGGNATIIYDFENSVSSAVLNIYDLSGKNIYSEKLNNDNGLHTHNLNTSTFNSEMYFVTVEFEGKRIQ